MIVVELLDDLYNPFKLSVKKGCIGLLYRKDNEFNVTFELLTDSKQRSKEDNIWKLSEVYIESRALFKIVDMNLQTAKLLYG